MEHCKRESVVKLVNIEKPDSFCYAAVTRGGRVGIYDGELNLLHSYEMFYHRSGVRRRIKNCWITDAIYLMDVQYLMLAASDRSLTFYDAGTLTHTLLYCVTGLPNIPTCLAYSPSARMGDSSELAIGTERGDVIRMLFHQPRLQFLYTKASDSSNYYFWMELSSAPHTSHVSLTTWRRVHSRTIRRVCYVRDGDMLISCSHDNTISVRIRHVPGKMEDYVFRVQRGVSCFHAVAPLRLLATGGCDGSLRLWEHTQATPFATLAAPAPAHVLDVAVLPHAEIVVAFCNNFMVHVWDIYEECLLQSIKIKFPFLGVLGKKIEFGNYCIFPGPLRHKSLEVPLEAGAMSRRGSSVVQGSTGGLVLLPHASDCPGRRIESDPEYQKYNRSEILLVCCDYACVISLRDKQGEVLPPPGDTLRPRRPSVWDLPVNTILETASSKSSPRLPSAPSPRLLEPATAQHCEHDLDTLLQNAGLQGILEKDFVLMQRLKHDLNKKLAEMEENKQAMVGAVSVGAPYLGLATYEPEPVGEIDHMLERYKRVMRLFPGSSAAGTPTGSHTTTPRYDKNFRL
ncbi:uncharacterized protein LOC115446116 isoform X2 [Manduca sexta]|uniref:uncharacterized protein LOC115446116 isoform X2 n=1 Tax=Manduca sexta TaxID=7130 RepID=UPI0011840079|nr:uncharacterized protein LOC115446116 isoform X2 [Manduca sexta]